jgi:hypothetical protein
VTADCATLATIGRIVSVAVTKSPPGAFSRL